MRTNFLFIIIILLTGCWHKSRLQVLSFRNKWGVVCYFNPTFSTDQPRVIFLPLENPSDSIALKDSSSIFDFKYGPGMDFKNQGQSNLNYKIYWISDHKHMLSQLHDTTSKILWVFAKLIYHQTSIAEPSTSTLFKLTLFNKNKQLPIRAFDFDRRIAVDTVYFKKKYVAPIIDTAMLKLRKNKLNDSGRYFR